MAEMSPMRRRMIEDMTVRNLSLATQRSYIHAVAKFSRHFCRSPDRLGLEDVRNFQVELISQGISWASLNQTVAALRFFYGVTLEQAEIPERIAYAREPRRLPVVLGADEVVRFLEAVPSLKSRTALTTAYAAGLRVSEVIALKVTDIDSSRMLIRVATTTIRKTASPLDRLRLEPIGGEMRPPACCRLMSPSPVPGIGAGIAEE
jgi:site-specific recombinase XerD